MSDTSHGHRLHFLQPRTKIRAQVLRRTESIDADVLAHEIKTEFPCRSAVGIVTPIWRRPGRLCKKAGHLAHVPPARVDMFNCHWIEDLFTYGLREWWCGRSPFLFGVALPATIIDNSTVQRLPTVWKRAADEISVSRSSRRAIVKGRRQVDNWQKPPNTSSVWYPCSSESPTTEQLRENLK